MYLARPLATLFCMTRLLVALPLLALALSGCGGGDEPEPVGEPVEAAQGTPVAQVDLVQMGAALEAEWGVECGDRIVDMAGYPKVVCGIPDELMSPGMSSNAVALQSFEETGQAEQFRDSYVTEGDGFVIGDGWFVQAPSQEIADEAASVVG